MLQLHYEDGADEGRAFRHSSASISFDDRYDGQTCSILHVKNGSIVDARSCVIRIHPSKTTVLVSDTGSAVHKEVADTASAYRYDHSC